MIDPREEPQPEFLPDDLELLDEPEAERVKGDDEAFEREFGDGRPDENGPDMTRFNEIVDGLQSQLVRATDERDALRDQLLRVQADFQNFRKRQEQNGIVMKRQATENFALKLIPVHDNLARTVAAIDRGLTVEKLRGGIEAVERQLTTALESEGVMRVKAVGEPFDPHVHEALGMVEGTDHPSETVVEEIEAGYTLGEKLVRPARVRVAQ